MTKTLTFTTLPILGALAIVAVGALGYVGFAFAQTPTTTATGTTPMENIMQKVDAVTGGHVGKNGAKEEILTGETTDKVTAAAKAVLTDATIDRAETDAEGATYEAHMTMSDGSHVTLKSDSNYNVTAIEEGHKGGHR